MFLKPGTDLPDSRVFQHPTTHDVYLIGNLRQDTRFDVAGGDPYVEVALTHLVTPVTNGSAGLGELWRRTLRQEAGLAYDDPTYRTPEYLKDRNVYLGADGQLYGWRQPEKLADAYLDIELRTTSEETDTYEVYVGDYYAWTSEAAPVEDGDAWVLWGRPYQVIETYMDMGFRAMRIRQEPDPTVLGTIQDQSGRTYDPAQHKYVDAVVNRPVTMVFPEQEVSAPWASTAPTAQVAILKQDVGFTLQPGQTVTVDGHSRKIKTVATQSSTRQYILECE